MSDETEENEIKSVGEYLQFLQEGVQYSLDLQSSLLQIVGDFAHDQGHAWDRLMDSLGAILDTPPEVNDGPHLTVVSDDDTPTG
tara:strand:- start:258 stop:509 length:252 start_codon:yes stop_codon:yes gene_type:complete